MTWKRAEKVIVFLLLAYAIHAGFSAGEKPWRRWEIASIQITVIYSFLFYIKLLSERDIPGHRLPMIVLAVLAVGLVFIAALLNSGFLICTRFPVLNERVGIMGLLSLGSGLFCGADICLILAGSKYKESLKKSLAFSDAPVTIAFTTLWVYSWHIRGDPKLAAEMEPFFGGAVAFQMMLSNIVWALV